MSSQGGKQTVCLHFEINAKFAKYDKISKYLTWFWFDNMLIKEQKVEIQPTKVKNMSNSGERPQRTCAEPTGHAL